MDRILAFVFCAALIVLCVGSIIYMFIKERGIT